MEEKIKKVAKQLDEILEKEGLEMEIVHRIVITPKKEIKKEEKK